VLQWAGSQEELERRLLEAGWQPAPCADLKGILLWLSPQVELRELPVLPQVHDGSEDDLTLVHYGANPNTRWVLRFWDIGVRFARRPSTDLGGQRQPAEAGTADAVVHLRGRRSPNPRAGGFTGPAWQGLRTQVVTGANPNERITLIAD
jgi:hypothetical protein